MQHRAHVLLALAVDEMLLVIRLAQKCQRHTVAAERRLDDVGDIVLVRLGVKVFQALAGCFLMTAEVVVRAVGNAPELAPIGEREGVFDVGRGTGVERELCRLMVAQAQVLFLDAEAQQPLFAVVLPVGKPLEVRVGLAEEFALHLLKLAGPEGEVARGDLVAERLADLADAERKLSSRRALDVCEVHEDALRGLRAQIAGRRRVLGDADGSLEHEVKLADGGEIVLAADGADDVFMLGDELVHLVEAHGVDIDLGMLVADQLVGAMTRLARLAVEQRVGEAGDVTGCDPGLRVHDDGSVETDVVGALLHEFLEPCLFDIVFELHTERTVVPAVCQTAVDFAAGEDKAAVFAEVDDHIEGLFGIFHAYIRPPDVI